jgi:hypothetical protein
MAVIEGAIPEELEDGTLPTRSQPRMGLSKRANRKRASPPPQYYNHLMKNHLVALQAKHLGTTQGRPRNIRLDDFIQPRQRLAKVMRSLSPGGSMNSTVAGITPPRLRSHLALPTYSTTRHFSIKRNGSSRTPPPPSSLNTKSKLQSMLN